MADYPAAQTLVNLRGTDPDPPTPRAVMEDVIRRFEPTAQLPNDEAAVAEIYRDLLSRHKSLPILDNARNGAQVHSLLPPPPSAAFITSRRHMDLPGVVIRALDSLDRNDAAALLVDLYVEHAPGAVPDAAALASLASACVDHPLALRVAGTFAANRAGRIDHARYVAQIIEQRDRLKLNGIPDHDVMGSLSLSLERLTEEDAGLAERWRDLAVFPADFDAAAAAAVWAENSSEKAIETLTELADRGFLEASGNRFRLHDLIRDLARHYQNEDRLHAAAARHAAHYLKVLADADALYLAGGAEKILSGLALYDREQANIHVGWDHAVTAMIDAESA